jgi:DNA-binding CsgD family transcriptional regulator
MVAAAAGWEMSPAIQGRGSELAAVERFLDRAAGHRALLVIEGEPGIGKTTVWEVALATAAERGFEVLSARPVAAEASLPLSGFGDLLLPVVGRAAGSLPPVQRHALEVALLLGDPTDAPADERTLGVAATALLRDLAADRAVLLAIDDLQWLDPSSARILAYALRRLAGERIGLLVSRRGGTAEIVSDLETWADSERWDRLVLGPLSVAALHALLQDRLGRSFSRLAMVRIQAESRGNPYYALEIARAIMRSGEMVGPGRPLPIPESLSGLTSERIATLPLATREALLLAALALEPPTFSLLRRSGIEDPEATLEPAVAEGIVGIQGDEVRFSHPLVASAVTSRASTERARATHAVLATVVESDQARAQHRARASAGPDAEAALDLDRAAAQARLRGAPIAAAELYELAANLTPPDDGERRFDRLHEAAACYFETGESQRAADLLEALIGAQPAGLGRASALQLLAQVRARSLSFVQALSLAAEARAEADGDPTLAAGCELDLAFYAFCLGDLPAAVTHTRAALPYAEAAGLDALRAVAVACVSIAEFMLGQGWSAERMAEALALEDPLRAGPFELRPSFVHGLLLLWTGELDDALAQLTTLWTDLLDRGQDASVPFLALPLVVGALWRGDTVRAAAYAETTLQLAAINGEPVVRGLALSARALVDALTGSAEAVRSGATEALLLFRASQFNIYASWPLSALGLVELSLGNWGTVDELLRPLADGIVAMPAADPILGVVLPDEVEALVALGERTRAERYVAWLEEGGRRLDRPWALALAARSRGMLAAAAGDLDGALRCLDEALEHHQRLPIPFELARTLLVKGQVHRRRKEKRLARDTLEAALRSFEEIGAPMWAVRARSELARIGLRPGAPTELTDTERRVAELAARGMTNRQVAQAAFVSPKTVDNVLGRVYRKLGIASRAELGARMAASAAPAQDAEPASSASDRPRQPRR